MFCSEQLAWLIAFISSIVSDVHEVYPNYAWWALVYIFFCIIGVTVTVATDAERTYSVAVCNNPCLSSERVADLVKITGFLAAGLVFTTSAVNSLIYSSSGAKEAAAAGFILLSMVAVSCNGASLVRFFFFFFFFFLQPY